jgi:hypothetical protein
LPKLVKRLSKRISGALLRKFRPKQRHQGVAAVEAAWPCCGEVDKQGKSLRLRQDGANVGASWIPQLDLAEHVQAKHAIRPEKGAHRCGQTSAVAMPARERTGRECRWQMDAVCKTAAKRTDNGCHIRFRRRVTRRIGKIVPPQHAIQGLV